MKKVLQWILEIIETVLGIIWEIIKFVIKWLWKWIVRLNEAIYGMSVFITLLSILGRHMDSYMATHTSDYQRQFPESGFLNISLLQHHRYAIKHHRYAEKHRLTTMHR